mmetsp:Transcript_20819/g.47115  ORF Transcript_20819/g.47115 Transcript_20819/m.47115 type:complete len:218 (+) Transcript_20819:652-1305(+)
MTDATRVRGEGRVVLPRAGRWRPFPVPRRRGGRRPPPLPGRRRGRVPGDGARPNLRGRDFAGDQFVLGPAAPRRGSRSCPPRRAHSAAAIVCSRAFRSATVTAPGLERRGRDLDTSIRSDLQSSTRGSQEAAFRTIPTTTSGTRIRPRAGVPPSQRGTSSGAFFGGAGRCDNRTVRGDCGAGRPRHGDQGAKVLKYSQGGGRWGGVCSDSTGTLWRC